MLRIFKVVAEAVLICGGVLAGLCLLAIIGLVLYVYWQEHIGGNPFQ